MEILVSIAFAASGLALLCYGGNWLVDGGIAIAKRFQISPLIIGMTVVAYGTSTPELAASLAAGPHGSLVLGNIIGSNIANIGMVIGIAAILTPLAIKRKQIRVIVPIMIGFSVLLEGFITGVPGGILAECLMYKIQGSVLLAKADKAKPDPVASALLLESVNKLYGISVDTEKMLKNKERIGNDFSDMSKKYTEHSKKYSGMYM